MYTIRKSFDFSASHQLDSLPEGHKCKRLHGHNYVVTVEMRGTLNGDGMVRDYGDLAVIKKWIDETLDHRHLNNILLTPTAEVLAFFIWTEAIERYPDVTAVSVSETPNTWAEYRP